MLYKDNKKVIDNNTLASLTILNPEEKDILIDLITKKRCFKHLLFIYLKFY